MSAFTDQEVIAACASAWADGHDGRVWYTTTAGVTFISTSGASEMYYNPLTDRAQAMELLIQFPDEVLNDLVSLVGTRMKPWKPSESEVLRAICECAARVQIEKENGNG